MIGGWCIRRRSKILEGTDPATEEGKRRIIAVKVPLENLQRHSNVRGKRRIIAVKVPLEGFQRHSRVRIGKKQVNCR